MTDLPGLFFLNYSGLCLQQLPDNSYSKRNTKDINMYVCTHTSRFAKKKATVCHNICQY